MARRLRIHAPGAFYHVTLRGNHRRDIFFCEAHRSWLNDVVADSIDRYSARVHAYCWMTNHVHMLMQVGDVPLGRVMLRIASIYARKVQRHLSTTGHLFERRYHSVLVDVNEYLLKVVRYIHLNPVRAKMVVSPEEYLWSSHHDYLGVVSQPWLTTELTLKMFGSDLPIAIARYKTFVSDELTQQIPDKPFEQLNENDRRILGDDNFLASIHAAAWRPRSRNSIDDIVEMACEKFGLSATDLKSRSARRVLARARAWIAHQCVVGRIASVSEIARRFARDESTLRESMMRYPLTD